MLRHVLTAACALMLVACQMIAQEPANDTSPVTGDTIEVTSLDAPVEKAVEEGKAAVAIAAPDVSPAEESAAGEPPAAETPTEETPVDPAPGDISTDEVLPDEEAPVAIKSPEQLQCERKGGTWARAGKSEARTCVKQTRDGGKQCTKGTQCEGLCLARSGTCAPLAPLFGCNEIFEDDGRRVTLCID